MNQLRGSWLARLLVENDAEPNSLDDNGQTPLALAMKYGHEDIMDLLVENGAKINPQGVVNEGKKTTRAE